MVLSFHQPLARDSLCPAVMEGSFDSAQRIKLNFLLRVSSYCQLILLAAETVILHKHCLHTIFPVCETQC